MNDEDARALDRLVERLDFALFEIEVGNYSTDVIKPDLYEKLLGGGTFTDCE